MEGGTKFMSKSIDKRVVEMQFDNKQFENNIQSTLRSLENLKKGLELKGVGTGLQDLDRTVKSFSLGHIASSVDSIADRFTTLGIIGVTALQNITNSAIGMAEALAKSVIIAPVSEGFSEYEMMLNAVQTTMAGTGLTAEQVEEQLKKLDVYADKTTYSTKDMLANLPKFTNAGVKIEPAISAMIGIANATARAGNGAREAGMAYYNLGQSIGAGYLSRIDFKSVEMAGVATLEWKNYMVDAAVAMGTLNKVGKDSYMVNDKLFTTTSLFVDGLQEKWATTDVMLKVFGDYGNELTDIGKKSYAAAQDIRDSHMLLDAIKASVGTGWKDSWQLLIGNLGEAKVLWTGIYTVMNDAVGKSAKARNDMLEEWKKEGGRDALINSLKNIYEGVSSIIKPITEAFREVFPPTTGKRLAEITKSFEALTARIKISGETAATLKAIYKGVFSVWKTVFTVIGKLINGISDVLGVLGRGLAPVITSIVTVVSEMGNFVTGIMEIVTASDVLQTFLGKIDTVLQTVNKRFKEFNTTMSGDYIKPLDRLNMVMDKMREKFENLRKESPELDRFITAVQKSFRELGEGITRTFEKLDFNKILSALNTGLFAAIVLSIRSFMKSLTTLTTNANDILSGVTNVLNGVRGCLESYQQSLKADILIKIATAIGLLAASIILLSTVDSDALAKGITAVSILLGELLASMSILSTAFLTKAGWTTMFILPSILLGLAVAIAVLGISLRNIAKLDWDQILKGVAGIGVLCTILSKATVPLAASAASLTGLSSSFILLGIALLIITEAVQNLSEIDTGKLLKGVLALGAVLFALAKFAGAKGVTKLKFLSETGFMLGVGLMLLATSMVIISKALEKISNIETGALLKGLIGLGATLTGLALFVDKIGGKTHMISIGVGLIFLGAAMLIFAKAITVMGYIPTEVMAKGLFVLGVSLTAIAIALNAMEKALPGAAAMFIVAAALLMLAAPLTIFGNLPFAVIATGLLTIAAVLVMFGGAAALLAPIAVELMFLSVAIALIGAGCMAAGLGVKLFAAGLLMLIGLGAAGAAGVAALGAALLELLPTLFKKLGEGLVAFADVIANSGPALTKALETLLLAMIDSFIVVIPRLTEGACILLDSLLRTLLSYMPKLIKMGMDLLKGFLDGVAADIGGVVKSAINVTLAFIQGIQEMLPNIIEAGYDLLIAFINGMADATAKGGPELVDAVNNLMDSLIYTAKYALGIASPSGEFMKIGVWIIEGLIEGLKSKWEALTTWAGNIGRAAIEATKNAIRSTSPSKAYAELGMYSASGFALGLKDYAYLAEDEAKNMGTGSMDALKRTIAKISDIVNADVDIAPTIRPVLDLSAITSGAESINSMLSKTRGITVDSISSRTAAISNTIPQVPNAVANIMANRSIEKLLGDLKTAMLTGDQNLDVTGEITLKGVNDMNQMVGVTNLMAREINWGNRRVPQRVASIPSRA
jgi:hypothetical protein